MRGGVFLVQVNDISGSQKRNLSHGVSHALETDLTYLQRKTVIISCGDTSSLVTHLICILKLPVSNPNRKI